MLTLGGLHRQHAVYQGNTHISAALDLMMFELRATAGGGCHDYSNCFC
jgi:hypothetical protein